MAAFDDDEVDPNGPTTDRKRHKFGTDNKADLGDDDGDPEETFGRDGRRDRSKEKKSYSSYDDDDDGYRKTERPGRDRINKDDKPAEIIPVGWLVIVKGKGVGHVLTIQEGNNLLGRSPTADLKMNFGDGEISADHALVSYLSQTGKFKISPGRGHITILRGDSVTVPEPLVAGDLITVGKTVLRFMPFCDASFDWNKVEVQ